MQERRNKRLVLLLVILSSATIVSSWLVQNDNSFTPERDLFKVVDINAVDEVMLSSSEDTVILKRRGMQWRVNGSPADERMVQVLLATIDRAEPQRPIASALKESVAEAMKSSGVKVTLSIADEVQQTFIASGNENKTQGYFKKEGDDEIYLMTIPGYRVYVSGIFELPEHRWRDKLVFSFNWRDFQSLEASFENADRNFTVVMENNMANLKGYQQSDTSRLNTFMDGISLLTADEYILRNEKLDSLAEKTPYAQFLIKDIANRNYTLELFPDVENRRFYGLIDKSQWAVFAEKKIQPLLRPKEFFMKR